jgi:hypothetical protein
MDTAKSAEAKLGIPEGYVAIPLSETQRAGPLRLCALARQTAEPVGGHLVVLRDLTDARVYLGCVTDAAGKVREWVELWVQNLDGLEGSLPAYREVCSNFSLDARWRQQVEAFGALGSGGLLATGWEATNPPPTFLDPAQGLAVGPGGSEPASRWELCRDDHRLQAAGLPAYSTSLARYLYQPSNGAGGTFVPVTTGAPESATTRPPSVAWENIKNRVAFNAQGGLMMALSFSPVPFDDYSDLLGGKPWAGVEHGKQRLALNGAYAGLGEWTQAQQDGAHLFLGAQGRAGRFVETYHLKLQLLVEAFRQVRAFVQQQQLPFLNLSAESFRVSLERLGSGLPILWTARCALVKAGAAFALPVETSDFRYFIRAGSGGTSIYSPEGLDRHLQGNGSVRIRKVMPPEQGRVSLEGTLVVQERPTVSPHDLLWIRLPLPAGRLDLYGHLYTEESLAQGEIRFRTLPQRFAPEIVKALQAAEGIAFARSPFEAVPLLSTPCDLYSLGVLAVRTLLVNPQNTLAVALDELLSLARQVAAEHKADTPLASRICAVMNAEPRFANSLAPHRLAQEAMEPMAAYGLLPPELWYHTLAAIVRLFPGVGPDSYCKDFGDAPALALEAIFNQPLEELEKLLVRSRSLIVIDWNANREVHSAIRDIADRERV